MEKVIRSDRNYAAEDQFASVWTGPMLVVYAWICQRLLVLQLAGQELLEVVVPCQWTVSESIANLLEFEELEYLHEVELHKEAVQLHLHYGMPG